MKIGFIKKASAIALSLIMLGSVSNPAYAHHRLDDAMNLKDAELQTAVTNKPMLAEYLRFQVEVGVTEFWESLDLEEMDKYFINEDGSVYFRNSGEKTAEEIAKKKAFEEKFKDYINRIEVYCDKSGLKFNKNFTDGKGNFLAGSSNGDGQGTNSLSVSNCVKGDVLLLNDGGVQIWGAIMHAGIYDGTSSDLCIYSASPNAAANNNNVGVRWERLSDWRKNDQAWTLYVENTSSSQKSYAFDYVTYYATPGEAYDWKASKSSTSKWYCSKIPWFAYKESPTGIDSDSDGGKWCWPIDIYNSTKTGLRNYYS